MAGEWYYAQGNQQLGPVELGSLQQMIQTGQLTGGDLVWRNGMANWVAAGTVPELFPSAGVAPAPASPYAASPYAASPYATAPGIGAPIGYYAGQTDVVYAGFWLRFCAWFIDIIITTIVGAIVGFIIGFTIGFATAARGGSVATMQSIIQGLANVAGLILTWLYSSLMESSRTQATLGKMALGLKVTDLEGNRIGFGRATGRHFGKLVSGIILLIGYFMAGFTERKQALHDFMAGTLVVKKSG